MDSFMKFLTGGVLGVVAFALFISFVPGSFHKMAKDELEKCEATLPRNQTCEIIAVPKESSK